MAPFPKGSALWHFRPLGALFRVQVGADLDVEGIVWLPGRGTVVIGRGVRLLARRAAIELRAHEGGQIRIDGGVVIEAGTSIEATSLVHVDAGARIGPFCKLMDNHFHRTVGDRGQRPEPSPVVVGVGAAVGPRAVLLPGTTLGPGARVGPGRVVSFRVPAGVEFGGEGSRAHSREHDAAGRVA